MSLRAELGAKLRSLPSTASIDLSQWAMGPVRLTTPSSVLSSARHCIVYYQMLFHDYTIHREPIVIAVIHDAFILTTEDDTPSEVFIALTPCPDEGPLRPPVKERMHALVSGKRQPIDGHVLARDAELNAVSPDLVMFTPVKKKPGAVYTLWIYDPAGPGTYYTQPMAFVNETTAMYFKRGLVERRLQVPASGHSIKLETFVTPRAWEQAHGGQKRRADDSSSTLASATPPPAKRQRLESSESSSSWILPQAIDLDLSSAEKEEEEERSGLVEAEVKADSSLDALSSDSALEAILEAEEVVAATLPPFSLQLLTTADPLPSLQAWEPAWLTSPLAPLPPQPIETKSTPQEASIAKPQAPVEAGAKEQEPTLPIGEALDLIFKLVPRAILDKYINERVAAGKKQ